MTHFLNWGVERSPNCLLAARHFAELYLGFFEARQASISGHGLVMSYGYSSEVGACFNIDTRLGGRNWAQGIITINHAGRISLWSAVPIQNQPPLVLAQFRMVTEGASPYEVVTGGPGILPGQPATALQAVSALGASLRNVTGVSWVYRRPRR